MSYENAFMQNDNRKIALKETAPLKFHINKGAKERDRRMYIGNMSLMQIFFLPCQKNTFGALKVTFEIILFLRIVMLLHVQISCMTK